MFGCQSFKNKCEKRGTDAIKWVIEQNSYTLELSSVREQVGAVTSQLNITNNRQNDKEKAIK